MAKHEQTSLNTDRDIGMIKQHTFSLQNFVFAEGGGI